MRDANVVVASPAHTEVLGVDIENLENFRFFKKLGKNLNLPGQAGSPSPRSSSPSPAASLASESFAVVHSAPFGFGALALDHHGDPDSAYAAGVAARRYVYASNATANSNEGAGAGSGRFDEEFVNQLAPFPFPGASPRSGSGPASGINSGSASPS